MIITLVLSACQRSDSGNAVPANPVNKFASLGRSEILEFKQRYTETFEMETTTSASFDEWWAFNDNLFLQLKDMSWLGQNCYANVEEVLRNGTIGLYDTKHDEKDGAPNGILNKDAMLSALVTNNLYAANADKCSDILSKTADQVVIGRTKSYEKQVIFIEQMRVLKNTYDNEIGKAAFKRFLDLYGQEFISWANGQLAEYDVTPFPADFIGFPTSGLTAKTSDRDWFEHYALIYAGVKPSNDPRFSKEMYLVTWNGPENKGYAMLYRQAAYEFMNQVFMSEDSQNAQNCGSGAPSLSTTVDENCNEVNVDPDVNKDEQSTP